MLSDAEDMVGANMNDSVIFVPDSAIAKEAP